MQQHLVATGLPGLDAALAATGRFAAVHPASGLADVGRLVKSELAGLSKAEVVFLFADSVGATNPNFEQVLTKLATDGWKVVVIDRVGDARRIVGARTNVGLLAEHPLTVNMVLAAISGLPGVGLIEPVADGGTTIVFTDERAAGTSPTAPAAATPPATPAAWSTTPATAPAPAPTPAPATGRPAWGTKPIPTPAVEAPAAPSFTPAPAPAVAPAAAPVAEPVQAYDPFAGSAMRAPMRAPQQPEQAPAATPGWAPTPRPGSTVVSPERPGRRGYVISVVAPKGGTGKSTLSVNLAVAMGLRLRATGKTVCLLDVNIQQSDVGPYLGAFAGKTVVNIAKDRSLLSVDRIGSVLHRRDDYGLCALLGPLSSADANPDLLNSDFYSSILVVLKQLFDYIIIDCPVAERYHDLVSGFAVPNSDSIIVPVIPSPQTLMNANRWLIETVTAPVATGGLGVDRSRIGIVLNRAEDDIGYDEDRVQKDMASWNYLGSIPESKAWKRSFSTYTPPAALGIHDLNAALCYVLWQATGRVEPTLEPIAVNEEPRPSGGILDRARGLLGRKK